MSFFQVAKVVMVRNSLVVMGGAFHNITFVMADQIARVARMRAVKFVQVRTKEFFYIYYNCVCRAVHTNLVCCWVYDR